MIEGRTGECVPKNLSEILNLFLTLSNYVIECKVTGKRINRRAGNGLEIPVLYNCFGPEKAVDQTEKDVKKVTDGVEKRTKNDIK